MCKCDNIEQNKIEHCALLLVVCCCL